MGSQCRRAARANDLLVDVVDGVLLVCAFAPSGLAIPRPAQEFTRIAN